jgi:4-hydroxybenzoate polyprenyltransferase
MMDKQDDPNAGIRSTAVLFGHHARLILSFFAFMFILGLTSIGFVTHQRLPFFVLSVQGAALHLTWQITTVVFEDTASCLKRFQSNGKQLGYIVWSGMLINYSLS